MRTKKEINLAWVLFIVIGLAVSIVPVKEYLESRQSKTWQVVKGIITVSNLKRRPYGKLFGYPKDTYIAKIKYAYWVNGKKYIGDKVRFGWVETDNREAAANIKNKYSVDSIADVYFNPKEPSESVLDPLINLSFNLSLDWPLLIIVAGPGFIVFGVIILIFRKKLIE